MKTTTIVIDTYKDTDLSFNAKELGFTREDGYKIFEYGEYIHKLKIIVDENLNVIGGKLYPHDSSFEVENKQPYVKMCEECGDYPTEIKIKDTGFICKECFDEMTKL